MRTENGKILCNCCKKVVQEEGRVLPEDFLHVEKSWGYFSKKDGERQGFDLCEECYDVWTRSFQIPVKVQEMTELI